MSTNAWLGAVAVGDGLGELGDGAGDGIGAAISILGEDLDGRKALLVPQREPRSARGSAQVGAHQLRQQLGGGLVLVGKRPEEAEETPQNVHPGLLQVGQDVLEQLWRRRVASERPGKLVTAFRNWGCPVAFTHLHASSAASYTSGGSSGGSSAPREYRSTSMRNTGSLEPFRGPLPRLADPAPARLSARALAPPGGSAPSTPPPWAPNVQRRRGCGAGAREQRRLNHA
eukprot:scaffold1340_cov253-Pinguiococcus_pyrenoidosus.AAC.9